MIYAGAEVLFYGLAAAASALVLAATFVVIRSVRPRTNGIAFLSGFVFGTLIACGLGLALGQAAVTRFDSHETFKAVATIGLGLALLAVGLQVRQTRQTDPAVRGSRAAAIVDGLDDPAVRGSRAAAIIGGLGNVGPAFGFAGPLGSYESFSSLSKGVMIALMWMGRVEIIPIIVLFTRQYWRA